MDTSWVTSKTFPTDFLQVVFRGYFVGILEGIRRNFFWGGDSDHRKIAWMGWDKVINDSKFGGLGIGSLSALNLCLMAKWWWKFKTQNEALWKKTIMAIHGEHGYLGGVAKSGFWGTICKLNKWLGLGNIDLRSFFYEDEQRWCWGLEDDGNYTVASLKKLIDESNLKRNDFETIWCKVGPKKVNLLLWRCYNNRLPTRDNLSIRGIDLQSVSCPMCGLGTESVQHLFIDCPKAVEIRRLIKQWHSEFGFNHNDVYEEMKDLLKSTSKWKMITEAIFIAYFWTGWSTRNEVVHQNVSKGLMAILMDIKLCSFNWLISRGRHFTPTSWDLWVVNPSLACNLCA